MNKERDTYWFPAKRYGWGWGPPTVWQGWFVLVVYFALIAAAAMFFLSSNDTFAFIISTIVLTGALIAVCVVKGEPARWRWGNDS
jgi:hypothetical protein